MVRNSKMEPTFYEERAFTTREQLKRTMTLDLNPKGNKRAKLNSSVTAQPVLSSPDLNMLKLGSPELEKLIIDQHNGLVTTTSTPTQILFPKNVTEEQEIYVKGFVDALNELHHSDSSQGGNHERSGYMNLDGASNYSFPMSPESIVIKEEPQTVPNMSCPLPVIPLDMDKQEITKLERKRQRNRLAASKCRRRKLERIALLEDKVRTLKGENAELTAVVNRLKEQVYNLKEQVMDHVNSGCRIIVTNPHM
uniref:Putative transcriptional activator of the jun family n=2 Tax=Triatominae TaxID=70999 RepID=A0A0V0G7D7_TRIDM